MISSLLLLVLLVSVKSLFFLVPTFVILTLLKSKQRKKYLFFAFLLTFVLLLPANIELYFSPYPLIDTKFAEGFSISEWEKIKPGMSKNEVEQKIGVGNINSSVTMLPIEGEKACIGYTNDGRIEWIADFAWIGMGVCYNEQEIVTRTYQNIINN